jgi:hypothetical protein
MPWSKTANDPKKPLTRAQREERDAKKQHEEQHAEQATLARMRDALREQQHTEHDVPREPVTGLAHVLEDVINEGARYLVTLVSDEGLDEDECLRIVQSYDRKASAWRKATCTYRWPALSARERAQLEYWLATQLTDLAEALVAEVVQVRRADEAAIRRLFTMWVAATRPTGSSEMTAEAYDALEAPEEPKKPDTFTIEQLDDGQRNIVYPELKGD